MATSLQDLLRDFEQPESAHIGPPCLLCGGNLWIQGSRWRCDRCRFEYCGACEGDVEAEEEG